VFILTAQYCEQTYELHDFRLRYSTPPDDSNSTEIGRDRQSHQPGMLRMLRALRLGLMRSDPREDNSQMSNLNRKRTEVDVAINQDWCCDSTV